MAAYSAISDAEVMFPQVECTLEPKRCAGLPGRPRKIRTKETCDAGWAHISDTIGTGAYGSITKIFCGKDFYVFKTINPTDPMSLRIEALIQNILADVDLAPKVITYYMTEDNSGHLIMQALRDNLEDRIKRLKVEQRLSVDGWLKLIKPAFELLDSMHSLSIYHGDAHTGNFMFDHEDKLKVIDFGMSEIFDKGHLPHNVKIKDYAKLIGALERLRGDANFDAAVARLKVLMPAQQTEQLVERHCAKFLRGIKEDILDVNFYFIGKNRKIFLKRFSENFVEVIKYIDRFLPRGERTEIIKATYDEDGEDVEVNAIEKPADYNHLKKVYGKVADEMSLIQEKVRKRIADNPVCGKDYKEKVADGPSYKRVLAVILQKLSF
jgi:serine/threonine protein kinase